jgi:hypothetical protein
LSTERIDIATEKRRLEFRGTAEHDFPPPPQWREKSKPG